MSFLYPRTIAVHRQIPAAIAGDGGYAGLQSTSETVIAAAVPASIQTASRGSAGRGIANVPSDAGKTMWRIMIPRGVLAAGTIQVRDVIVDDLGARYQVGAPWNDSLGWAVLAELLSA